MFTKNELLKTILLITILVVTACAPQLAATSIPTSAPIATTVQDQTVTLRLAIADAQDRSSDPYVHEFIDQVATLSNGNITIEPIWDAGADTTPSFEQGVVKIVKEGQYDLGLAGSRAWDSLGVTSFQALQAPFLITNDALAEAVASSDIATRMLDGLLSVGVTGLALWPEDLRHPFSVVPGEPILAPADFEGKTVRVVPSEVSNMLIKILGGSPMFGDGDYQRAESGLRQGFSLTGTPTATGNVIFFPKFQVLFANGAAFEKLSEAQRAILQEAAAATQKKAIEEHPGEVDAATAWCADGGTIVMASEEQIAAFEKAAQPIFDSIAQDPVNAELITAIRELKAKTEPAAGAAACGPTIALASPEPEKTAWSQGLPPNGVWKAELTTDDFVRMGLLRSVAETEWAGIYTLTFQDGKYLMVWQSNHNFSAKCQANYEAVGEVVRLTYYTTAQECEGLIEDIQWRLDDEGLHLHLVATNGTLIEGRAFFEGKPWQKVK